MKRLLLASVALSVTFIALVPSLGARSAMCEEAWTNEGRVVRVRDVEALQRAVRDARPGDTILLANGTYPVRSTLEISVPRVTLRGESGDAEKVVIRGPGMTDSSVGVGIGVNAEGVRIGDVTVRDFGFHAVQVRGEQGASRFVLMRARLMDTGQQLLKGSLSARQVYADNGTVACSEFSYTDHAPTNYTNGVDLIGVRGWTIRDNRFERIRGPQSDGWASGPTILVWGAAESTAVERNVIVDSFRGIALGLAAGTASYTRNGEKSYDHLQGIIRNNIIVNLHPWADEAIEANAARDVRIEHNTVLVEGNASWSIGVRFPTASAIIRNNLTNRQVLLRDGGRAQLSDNVTSAVRGWFVKPEAADLHLLTTARTAARTPTVIADNAQDFDGVDRTSEPMAGALQGVATPPGGTRRNLP